jgi:hypothetical protein
MCGFSEMDDSEGQYENIRNGKGKRYVRMIVVHSLIGMNSRGIAKGGKE